MPTSRTVEAQAASNPKSPLVYVKAHQEAMRMALVQITAMQPSVGPHKPRPVEPQAQHKQEHSHNGRDGLVAMDSKLMSIKKLRPDAQHQLSCPSSSSSSSSADPTLSQSTSAFNSLNHLKLPAHSLTQLPLQTKTKMPSIQNIVILAAMASSALASPLMARDSCNISPSATGTQTPLSDLVCWIT